MSADPETYEGEHNGAPYRICVPRDWNGSLILTAQGWGATGPNARYKDNVDIPVGNPHLLDLGYAWAASGFHPKHFIPHNDHNFVPHEAAGDLHELHAFFRSNIEIPTQTYLTGLSMGGDTVLHYLERFPDDAVGAIVWATAAGLATLDYEGHTFILGALAAGIAPHDYEGPESIPSLSSDRILPELEQNARAGEIFSRMWESTTGGARAHSKKSVTKTYAGVVGTVPLIIRKNAFDNTDYRYPADSESGLDEATINEKVIRIGPVAGVRNVDPNFSDPSGRLPVPLMMVHTTGDTGTPLHVLRSVHEAAERRGDSDRLVQRAIQAPGHGDFSGWEGEKCWDDFFAWVNEGKKPEGDDLSGSLEKVGEKFTDPGRVSERAGS